MLLSILLLSAAVSAQSPTFGQWCGKYYQIGAPHPTARPEGSLFNYPQGSSQPLLDFQCTTKSSLYIEDDEQYDQPMILVDTNITYDVGQEYHGDWSGNVRVDVWSDNDNYLAGGDVPLNSMGSVLAFNLSSLQPQSPRYNLTCKAQANGQTYYTTSSLSYLPPNPYGGNTVKIDRSSGALLVRNETDGADKMWQRMIPFGYYDSYNSTSDATIYGSGYGNNAVNDTLNRLHLVKSLGFNLVHPVPPGGFYPYTFDAEATEQFEQYISTAESLGLYVQYDMRNSYKNLSSVTYQVEYLRNRSNILMWYTGDEPDGAVDPLNATKLAYDTIYQTDGYHPVSLVLNCENYYFSEYGACGSDIIMVDPYPIAMNGRWSKPYATEVDENFGDSGCDNCQGSFYDISTRIESTRDRTRILGQYRNKPAWIVPQSFNDGQHEFWYRVPTGGENAVNNILSWNHGGTGSVAWNSQYSSQELLGNSSIVAKLLYNQSRFVVDAYDSRKEIFSNLSYPGINGIDLASWTISNTDSSGKTETLIMAANTLYGPNDSGPEWNAVFTLANYSGSVKEVLLGNVSTGDDDGPVFFMPRTSVAAVILEM